MEKRMINLFVAIIAQSAGELLRLNFPKETEGLINTIAALVKRGIAGRLILGKRI